MPGEPAPPDPAEYARAEAEQALFRRARQGDPGAFQQLAANWSADVYSYMALVSGFDAAPALVVAAFSQLARSLRGEKQSWPEALWAVAYRVASNAPPPGPDALSRSAPVVGARALGPRQHALLALHVRQQADATALARVLAIGEDSARSVLSRLLPAARRSIIETAGNRPGNDPLAAYASVPPPALPAALETELAAALSDAWGSSQPPLRSPDIREVAPFEAPRDESLAPARKPLALVALLGLGGVAMAAMVFLVPGSPLGPDGAGRDTTRAFAADSPTATAAAVATVAPSPSASPAPALSPSPSAGATRGPSPSPAASLSPGPAATRTAGPSPWATASPTETPSPAPTPSATPTATASPTATTCKPQLSPNTPRVSLPANGASTLTIYNNFCGPTSFIVTIPIGAEWLAVAPLEGTVKSGDLQNLNLQATVAAPGQYTALVSVSWPAGSFSVQVTYQR